MSKARRAPAREWMGRLGAYLRNLLRPWKATTFLLGTSFFVWGALYYQLPTWDVGVSVLMSVACYLFAPWAVSMGMEAVRWRIGRWWARLLLSVVLVYLVGSGSYEVYNTVRMGMHPVTYWENLFFSLPVTIIAGVVWRFDGSLRALLAAVLGVLRRP